MRRILGSERALGVTVGAASSRLRYVFSIRSTAMTRGLRVLPGCFRQNIRIVSQNSPPLSQSPLHPVSESNSLLLPSAVVAGGMDQTCAGRNARALLDCRIFLASTAPADGNEQMTAPSSSQGAWTVHSRRSGRRLATAARIKETGRYNIKEDATTDFSDTTSSTQLHRFTQQPLAHCNPHTSYTTQPQWRPCAETSTLAA